MSKLRTVTMSERDWSHVVNAVASSYDRKIKRGTKRAADEMMMIGNSIIRQCSPPPTRKKEGSKA